MEAQLIEKLLGSGPVVLGLLGLALIYKDELRRLFKGGGNPRDLSESLLKANLDYFQTLNGKVNNIEHHLAEIATSQRSLLNEVLRQSGFMEGNRK